jgi:hypothetical protein
MMKLDNSYCITHDVYGKAVYADFGDDQIVNYFIHNNQLVISTYNRRTTATTEKVTSLPKSLV